MSFCEPSRSGRATWEHVLRGWKAGAATRNPTAGLGLQLEGGCRATSPPHCRSACNDVRRAARRRAPAGHSAGCPRACSPPAVRRSRPPAGLQTPPPLPGAGRPTGFQGVAAKRSMMPGARGYWRRAAALHMHAWRAYRGAGSCGRSSAAGAERRPRSPRQRRSRWRSRSRRASRSSPAEGHPGRLVDTCTLMVKHPDSRGPV